MAIREGKWKCTYCGAVNRGRDVECAACGAAREKDVTFFLEDDAPEVTDEAQLAAARAGAEWLCETCGASNPSSRETCEQCGAPRGASARRAVREIPLVEEPPPAPAAAAAAPGCLKRFAVPLAVGGGALALLLVLVLVFVFRTHTERLTVAGAEWTRSVEVEELRTLTEQGWDNEVPSDARVVSSRREVHHTEQVQVGTKQVQESYTERVRTGTRRVKTGVRDLGNGYFEDVYEDQPVYQDVRKTRTVQQPVYQDRPVYRNRVTYQVDRWQRAGEQRAQGQDLTPRWPAVGEGPKRRVAKQTGRYVVHLAGGGKVYDYEVTEDEFARYVEGSTVTAEINSLGSIKSVRPE